MSGQLFTVASEGGYLWAPNLSTYMRTEVQPRCKFRQLCDGKDFIDHGLHRGSQAYWNIYSKIANQGGRLTETQTMPESGFTVTQRSLTVFEGGNSVPYTGRLDALGEHDVTEIIDKALRDDVRKFHDLEAFNQFNACQLRVQAASGTSTTSLTLTTNGATTETNNVAFGTGHHKAIVDLMKERHIPPFSGDDYVAISHPSTFRPMKNSLESVKQYTETGIGQIFRGEVGRYDGARFIEQDYIAKGGADDSTTYDPSNEVADAWNNGLSSWIFYMGDDTVAEALVIPEEIRAKLPGDYGRSRGIAWYYLGGYGLIHSAGDINARILKWDSAA
jgi:N4-gp56 family major capsid protein